MKHSITFKDKIILILFIICAICILGIGFFFYYRMEYFFGLATRQEYADYKKISSSFYAMQHVAGAGILLIIFMCICYGIQRNLYSKQLEKTRYYDQLTGAPNVKKFKQLAHSLIKKNHEKRFFILQFDIFKFKMVNELYGTIKGNEVLQSIGLVLSQLSKKKESIYARDNADTFLLLGICRNLSEVEEIQQLFEKTFCRVVSGMENHKIIFRYGRYLIANGENNIDLILEKVNIAHNCTKKESGLYKCDYTDVKRQTLVRETEFENMMEAALELKEFAVYFQPKFFLQDGKLAGAEALVRWQRNGKFIASPGQFIPLFEKNGFIIKLDMYMLEEVCKIIKEWINKGLTPLTVSINFSRVHLFDPLFTEQIDKIVRSYGIPEKYIEIELTESVIFDNEEILTTVLEKLHRSGYTLSMDDFGKGYSSLGLLKELPVDVIKFDRSFFMNSSNKERTRVVVLSILEMAKKLGISTVAEGIENSEDALFFTDVPCDIVQGFYYGRPTPASAFSHSFLSNTLF